MTMICQFQHFAPRSIVKEVKAASMSEHFLDLCFTHWITKCGYLFEIGRLRASQSLHCETHLYKRSYMQKENGEIGRGFPDVKVLNPAFAIQTKVPGSFLHCGVGKHPRDETYYLKHYIDSKDGYKAYLVTQHQRFLGWGDWLEIRCNFKPYKLFTIRPIV